MNVYFYLSTRDLVTLIRVCGDAKYSIKEKYDRLPITKNTIQEYTLKTTYTNRILLCDCDIIMDINSNQISSTLRRSINRINIDLNQIELYQTTWFHDIKCIHVRQTRHITKSVQNSLASIIMHCLNATKVSYYFPISGYIRSGLPFPPNMRTLKIQALDHFGHNFGLFDFKEHNNQHFPEKLQELTIAGFVNNEIITRYILKPGLLLKLLKIENIPLLSSLRDFKHTPCEEIQVISKEYTNSWGDVLYWSLYDIDQTIIPHKMSIKCHINSFTLYNFNAFNDTLVSKLSKTTTSSPLEDLQLYARNEGSMISLCGLNYWVTILTQIIQSKLFPKLKSMSLFLRCTHIYYNSGTEQRSVVNGVSLMVNVCGCVA